MYYYVSASNSLQSCSADRLTLPLVMRSWPSPWLKLSWLLLHTPPRQISLQSIAGRHQGWVSQDNCILFIDWGLRIAALTASLGQGPGAWEAHRAMGCGVSSQFQLALEYYPSPPSCLQSCTWPLLNHSDVWVPADGCGSTLSLTFSMRRHHSFFGGQSLNVHLRHRCTSLPITCPLL